jgi:hypothetical protein
MKTNKLSLINLKNCLRETSLRFPAAIGYAALFTILTMALVWHPHLLPKSQAFNLQAFLAEGALLSVMLKLCKETGQTNFGRNAWLCHLSLAAVAMLWMPLDYLGQELITAHLSIAVLLFCLCIFLPFRRETDDIASSNLGARIIKAAIFCPLAGIVPTVLLSGLIAFSFPLFFQLSAIDKDYMSIAIIFLLFLPFLLFLSRVPKGKRLVCHQLKVGKFAIVLIRQITMPLAVIYMCILYCYDAHIALAWELPNGGVSYMVAIMAAMVFAIEFYLYFVSRGNQDYTVNWYLRWLPIFMMPLLALMSIGICRRIADYGLTASRLYLATLNVWFYVVFLLMFSTRARRIHWIPLSFAALFALTSFLPFNYNTVARLYIVNDVQQRIAQHDTDDSEILSRQDYLRNTYGYEVTTE